MGYFENLIRNGGLIGLIAVGFVVFAESGLLIGILLPGGDTTLLLAGSFAATGRIPLIPLLIVIVAAAVIGDNVGYEIGKRTGKRIFRKKESFLFDPEHLVTAGKFYEKHGGKTIILARFVPMVRTFAPLIAGVGQMPRRRFMLFNIIGAFIWGVGVTMAGYLLASILGERVEDLEKYLIMAVGITTVVAFAPAAYHFFKLKTSHSKKTKEEIAEDKEIKEELKEIARDIEEDVQH
jgi:membrane-associated protein